jgi:pyridinium-3,5-biscarboxylic acid mononucleotide sulfurtransferase
MEDGVYRRLLERLGKLQAVSVAFSGGADSALLLAAAKEALGDRVLALTAVTPYMVRQEISDALALAAELGVRHQLVELPMPEGMDDNPPDRCYLCKRALYTRLMAVADEQGFAPILDGSNLDDLTDYRPGLRALGELGVKSPFLECGIAKEDVRRLAQALGLPTWRKPTNTCLLTRMPFGRKVTMEGLQRIEEAERLLLDHGYDWVRVRCHGDLARIEVAPQLRLRVLEEAELISDGLEALGFRYVTLDLRGYQLGSMNVPG